MQVVASDLDVAFPPLVPGRLLRRLSRFHAEVEAAGRPALAHLPNSGRLREAFLPGGEVLLARRTGARRTAFDLLLARLPDEECAAPRGGGWACLDARLPARILAAAVERGAVPGLAGMRAAAVEPRLGAGRTDLLLAGPGGGVLVEAKSITLVRAGAGLFPDCPTARGAGRVDALRGERGRRRVLALVVQRADARAVRIHEPADRRFAAALRAAIRAGVEVVCGTCDVSPAGIRWRTAVALEWFSPGAAVHPLPDHLPPGLRLLFCGLNPGRYSAWYGMYFARPANLFWPATRAAGLVPPTARPGDEPWLCRTLGIGFTDVVKRPTGSIDELRPEEWESGAAGRARAPAPAPARGGVLRGPARRARRAGAERAARAIGRARGGRARVRAAGHERPPGGLRSP